MKESFEIKNNLWDEAPRTKRVVVDVDKKVYMAYCREHKLCIEPYCEGKGFPYCTKHDAP